MSPIKLPSLYYRGPNDFLRFETMDRKEYIFSQENEWIVTPEKWEHLYELLAYENVGRLIVFSQDPKAEECLRRAPPRNDFELQFTPEYVKAKEQEEKERQRLSLWTQYRNNYINKINLEVASGISDHVPDHLGEEASHFADEMMVKESQSAPKQDPILDAPANDGEPAVTEEPQNGIPPPEAVNEALSQDTEPPVESDLNKTL